MRRTEVDTAVSTIRETCIIKKKFFFLSFLLGFKPFHKERLCWLDFGRTPDSASLRPSRNSEPWREPSKKSASGGNLSLQRPTGRAAMVSRGEMEMEMERRKRGRLGEKWNRIVAAAAAAAVVVVVVVRNAHALLRQAAARSSCCPICGDNQPLEYTPPNCNYNVA